MALVMVFFGYVCDQWYKLPLVAACLAVAGLFLYADRFGWSYLISMYVALFILYSLAGAVGFLVKKVLSWKRKDEEDGPTA
jgi:hypothetical protein